MGAVALTLILIEEAVKKSEIGGEEAAAEFKGKAATVGVVTELVFAYFADGEITGLRMGEHEAGDTGVGLHSATLGETDADLFHIEEVVEDEIQAGVGQRGITHGRTDALELFDEHVRYGKFFILRITPVFLSDLFVHTFCRSLSKTVCKELGHHFFVRV